MPHTSAKPPARLGLPCLFSYLISRTVEDGFGESYARTLEEWWLRFQKAWPKIEALGFGDCFKRTWEYYLAYSQVGFETGALNVGLYGVTRAASI